MCLSFRSTFLRVARSHSTAAAKPCFFVTSLCVSFAPVSLDDPRSTGTRGRRTTDRSLFWRFCRAEAGSGRLRVERRACCLHLRRPRPNQHPRHRPTRETDGRGLASLGPRAQCAAIDGDCCSADPQSGVAPGLTRGRNVRSRYRCSMCPAIHINSSRWLRSSSTREPSDPPPRVVILVFCFPLRLAFPFVNARFVFVSMWSAEKTRAPRLPGVAGVCVCARRM